MMSRSYVYLSIFFAALVGFGSGWLAGTKSRPVVIRPDSSGGACCALPIKPAAEPAPRIPTGLGRPCLVVFALANEEAKASVAPLLEKIKERWRGKIEIVVIDPSCYPAEAQRWRLRMAPTWLLVDAHGQERWRHEGPITEAALAEALRAVSRGRQDSDSRAAARSGR